MKRHYGFTLAEVLITLAIIGVVAALSIPAVISNSQQQEFKTGLRKAVSVLNSAITMNMALDGESPYDNANLFGYLMKHMSVVKKGFNFNSENYNTTYKRTGLNLIEAVNAYFYTTDGMLFVFSNDWVEPGHLKLHESNYYACSSDKVGKRDYEALGIGDSNTTYSKETAACGGCGSLGMKNNPNNTTKTPCAIMVDVNGDRKPNPGNINCKYIGSDMSCAINNNNYAKGFPMPGDKLVKDIFTILITEDKAIPYGVTAQKAMYQAQK